MRKFTYALFSVVILFSLFSIILPSLGYTLAPLSGHDSVLSRSDASQNPRVIIAPDSPLYPIKRDVEQLQLGFSFKHNVKAQLLVHFAKERAAESAIMVNKNKTVLAAQAVSEMVNNLQTLEEMRDYLPPQTVADIDISVLQVKKDSVLAVADILNKSEETDTIRNYIQADQYYHDAIKQSEPPQQQHK